MSDAQDQHVVLTAFKWIAGNLLVPVIAAVIGVLGTLQVMRADIDNLKASLNELSVNNSNVSARLMSLEGIVNADRTRIDDLTKSTELLRQTDIIIRESMSTNTTLILRELSAVREAVGELKGTIRSRP